MFCSAWSATCVALLFATCAAMDRMTRICSIMINIFHLGDTKLEQSGVGSDKVWTVHSLHP